MTLGELRILLVGPLPPPAGGMANQTRQLAELLRGEGARVKVIQVNAPYRPEWIARIRGLRAFARIAPYLFHLWREAGRVDLVHVMANSGWSWHLFAAPAVWIGHLRGKPVVINYRGGEADAFLSRAAAWVRPTIQRGALLALPSGFLLEIFGRHGMPGHVIPNIIDLARFRPSAEDENSQHEVRGPHIVVARNLEHIYGIDIALKAFAITLSSVPNARLSIAGSGPLESELKELADRLGISTCVTFTGRLDRDEMAALYRVSDISLNPSRVDNMPNSVLEALASEVPVVTTNVGGIPHMVEDGQTALLVPADDPLAMAEAVARLLNDANLANRLRLAGRQEVSRYSWDAVKEVLLHAYQRAMKRNGQPSVRQMQEY